jgi:hypothetical protein
VRLDALIHCGERGSKSVSTRYAEHLGKEGIEPSVGSNGDSQENNRNALAATMNGLYTAELMRCRVLRKRTRR